jgi:hypothetical protein
MICRQERGRPPARQEMKYFVNPRSWRSCARGFPGPAAGPSLPARAVRDPLPVLRRRVRHRAPGQGERRHARDKYRIRLYNGSDEEIIWSATQGRGSHSESSVRITRRLCEKLMDAIPGLQPPRTRSFGDVPHDAHAAASAEGYRGLRARGVRAPRWRTCGSRSTRSCARAFVPGSL